MSWTDIQPGDPPNRAAAVNEVAHMIGDLSDTITPQLDALSEQIGRLTKALWLPGTTTDYLAGPSGLDTALASGFDLRIKYRQPPAPAATAELVRLASSATAATFRLLITTAGGMLTRILAPGNQDVTLTPAQLGNPTVGAWVCFRQTYSTANGQRTQYLSTDDGATWTQINQSTIATTLQLGAAYQLATTLAPGAGGGAFQGALAWLSLAGFDGTPAASCDLSSPWSPQWRDPEGNLWTLTGTGCAWTDQ